MNYKKKLHHNRVWRKSISPTFSIKEWSRMLHLWWKRDVIAKREFKKSRIGEVGTHTTLSR